MFESTKELRQLIIDNPDLPLVIFATEDANDGEPYGVETKVLSVKIADIAIYEDDEYYPTHWVEKEELYDIYTERFANEDEYKDLDDDEYDRAIEDKVSKIEFTKCIYVLVGN